MYCVAGFKGSGVQKSQMSVGDTIGTCWRWIIGKKVEQQSLKAHVYLLEWGDGLICGVCTCNDVPINTVEGSSFHPKQQGECKVLLCFLGNLCKNI